MNDSPEMIKVQANLDITVTALQTVVANAKKNAGKDKKGMYRVDTAGCPGKIISQFLYEHNFEVFAGNEQNYRQNFK